MSVIVTDSGFAADDLPADAALVLPSDTDPASLSGINAAAITVEFPSFADGRGFTIARALRDMGFTGRLRARGHVIADQYAMARRAGFDEVEISDDLAAGQPQDQWVFRAVWQAHNYQARLRGLSALLPAFPFI